MPRPVAQGQRYVAGLDGIRAVAVLCVIAYHLNVPGAGGGMLGVGVFFTLSGYLITDLLLGHWRRYGEMGLGQFWLRRARRLLPALFVMLVAVSIYVALFDAEQLHAVRRQVIAAALYFSNWSTIAQQGSYFARFAMPLHLDHLWSLAIEEQFYLLWPWLLLAGIWVVRSRRGLVLLTLCGAAFSAWLMGHMYQPGYDPTRPYEGTDTRAFGLLIGAALAMVWSGRMPRASRRAPAPALLDLAGVAGLIGIFVLVWRTDAFTPFLYPWGFLLLAVATAVLVAAVVNPASTLGSLLGWAPLRWIGVRSYGIYLWQWPIIVFASPHVTTFNWGRAALEVAGTFLVAHVSWRYIEEPIRRGALGRLWRRARGGPGSRRAQRHRLALLSGAGACVLVTVLGLTGALPVASTGPSASAASERLTRVTPVVAVHTTTVRVQRVRRPLPTHSSCRAVIYIGDSTSEGETSVDYIPNPRQRLPAQLAKVGVTTTIPEISGARSIVETFQGHPNAATVAEQHIVAGYHGCWILALGTNDVDNVADASPIGFDERIEHMMKIIGDQPTMWITAVTLLKSGPYAEKRMQVWDRALLTACKFHSNMRVFDWAAWAKPRWFIPDGIHYYTPGYIARSHRIALGLAHAFPEGQPPSAGCVVR